MEYSSRSFVEESKDFNRLYFRFLDAAWGCSGPGVQNGRRIRGRLMVDRVKRWDEGSR